MRGILANRIAPVLIDRYLAKAGSTGQLTDETSDPDAPRNLFDPVRGAYAAHGRFDARARPASWEMFTSRHRDALLGCGLRGGGGRPASIGEAAED